MKKYILNTIIIVLLISLVGCSDDYFEVNRPTGSADLDQIRMADLLGPVILHTINAQYYAETSFGNYTQHFTGQGGNATEETSVSGVWSRVYLYALPNLNVIIDIAEQNNAKNYEAIAYVLKAINLGIATDSYDNIPYSQASQGAANTTPAFDSQESIYNEIFSLLDNAISLLEQNDDSGFSIGDEDLVYEGEEDQWLKAAYTLKARYQLHLSKVNGSTVAGSAALVSIENGFTSNSDDFQVFFNELNQNPWYIRQVLRKHTGNTHDKIGDQLVSTMDGSYFPFVDGIVTRDPRLPIYAETDDASDDYRGYLTGGDGESSGGTNANTDFREEGYYTNSEAPLVLISYAEAMFIKAEAAFIAAGGDKSTVGGSAEAYNAYLEGISANMNKLSADGSDYIADGSVAVGEAGLMLKHIMKEKYIANFLNPETYVDFRRYDFSNEVFVGLELPVDNADSEFPGEWYRRASYPSSESLRNPDNVAANSKSPTEPVWWEQ